MTHCTIAPLLSIICSQFKLGDLTSKPEKLTGGSIHQNWKFSTTSGTYVLKKLNDYIAKKPGITEKHEETERIASKLLSMHIPAVAAVELHSHFVHAIDEHLFTIYPFVKGRILSIEHLQLSHAKIIGQLFTDIHSCQLHHRLSESTPHYDLFDNDHWISIIKRYNNPQLSSLLPTLLKWNESYHGCIEHLNQETLISHRDLHCSNVLWDGDFPHIIDWESVGYTNPLQEIIGYGLEWAGITHSQFNKDFFFQLTHSYRNQAQTLNTSSKDALFGWLGNSVLGWTEFNLRRAKDDCFAREEQARGIEILEKKMIPCLLFIEENMDQILGNIDKIWSQEKRSL